MPYDRRYDCCAPSSERPETWQAAFDLIRTRGYERRDEPFKLASGQLSHDYIDGKYAVDTGERLTIVSRAVADLAAAQRHRVRRGRWSHDGRRPARARRGDGDRQGVVLGAQGTEAARP